jgi:paired amphipathic helix protein Sin3a
MKSLVSEIEAILNEQRAKRADTFGQPDVSENPVHLEYFFRKSAIFEDCARVLRLFLLKGGSFSNNEKERIESFFHSVVLTAFEVSLKDETRLSKIHGLHGVLAPTNRMLDKLETQTPLKPAAIEPMEDKPTIESETSQRIVTDAIQPDLNALRSAVVSDDNGTVAQDSKNPPGPVAFVNSSLYVLLRAIQSFYARLMKIQSVAEKISRRPEKYRRTSSLALKLGIQKDFLPHVTEAQYYNELFSILDKFFDGELDQALFEDQVRYMFGTSAFVLFTIDKFCLNLCRLMLNIISDEKSLQLFELWQRYKNDQKAADGKHEALLDRYYDMSDRIVGSEYLYRISYESKERRLSVQLLDRGATSPESLRSLKERWVDYVDEYVKLELTGRDLLPKRPVFLPRNIPKTMDASSIMEQTIIKNNLECKICVNTYRMFFVENTYDLLYRSRPFWDDAAHRHERRLSTRRHEKFHQWWSTTRRDETLFGDVAEADARCDRWFEKGEGLLNLRRFSTRIDYIEDAARSKIGGLDHRCRVYRTELEDLGEIGTEPDTDQLNASDIAMDENEAPIREGEDEDSVMEDENMSSMISDEE